MILFYEKRPSHKELDRKINQAKAISKKNIRFIKEQSIADNLLDLDILIEEIPDILPRILNEIAPSNYAGQRPPDRSYENEIKDLEYFTFIWESKLLRCEMYLKFAFKENYLYLINIHQARMKRKVK